MRLLAVDGTNVVIRYAAALVTGFGALTPEAIVNAAPSVLASVGRAILRGAQEARCTHAVVALDSSAPLRRKSLYAAYKANRSGQTGLWSDLAEVHFRGVGMAPIRYPGEEADDILATLAARVTASGRTMAILSGDGDLLQLASPSVECWQFGRKGEASLIPRSESWICEKYGIATVSQLPLWKALVGDPSDNLPGVARIGPVRAKAILAEMPTADAIREGRPQDRVDFDLMLSLVTLRSDIPLEPIDPAACKLAPTKAFVSPAVLSRGDLERLRSMAVRA